MIRSRLTPAFLFVALLAVPAHAQRWYDHYDEGLKAVRSGDWNKVVQKMSAAIKENAKEDNKARTYGMNMLNYHPFYYRGAAYLQTGQYDQAIADLEKTSGPGPENLGSIDSLMDRARSARASASAPAPEPDRPVRPVVPVPTPVTPAAPQIDPALRQRATAALATAKGKIQAAQERRATSSPQFSQAMSMFTDATTRNATPRTNEDLNAVIALAQNAADFADLAMPPTPAPVTPAPVTPAPVRTNPIVPRAAVGATTTVMEEADYSSDVRRALEDYFNGEFASATEQFGELTRRLPTNGWLWAFLGASQYSQYAFDADERKRDEALRSFRRARELRNWRDGLPANYFSPRIRKAFSETL